MFFIWILEILQVVGMYFILGEVPPAVWWTILILLLLMFFGVRTYYTAKRDGSDEQTIRFWYQARSIIFVLDVLTVCAIYGYLLFGHLR